METGKLLDSLHKPLQFTQGFIWDFCLGGQVDGRGGLSIVGLLTKAMDISLIWPVGNSDLTLKSYRGGES